MEIVEIFESIQGEGKYAGARQIFVRSARCPVGCDYCDTDFAPKAHFRVNKNAYNNPVTVHKLADILTTEFQLKEYHSISFTGGEPLIYLDELCRIAPLLKVRGAKLFLETSGYDPRKVQEAGIYFDYISLDIKTIFTHFEDHLKKLLATVNDMQHSGLYLKLVLRPEDMELVTVIAEYMRSAGLNELWVQPVDNFFDWPMISDTQKIFALQGVNAYFMPQLHKMLEIR